MWENTYDNEIAILYQISQIHEMTAYTVPFVM